MAGDILQQFLEAQLFSVEGEDARLAKIREATTDLTGDVDGARFLQYLLAAANPKAKAESAPMQVAKDALAAKWNSYTNCFSSPPIGLFRGMLLQSATTAADEDDNFVAAGTLLLRNILPRRDFGKEAPLWQSLAGPLDAQYEAAAATVWSDNFKTGLTKPLAAKIDRAKLTAAIVGAVGPTGADGKPGTNPNPNFPNTHEAWAHEFAPRMTAAIGDALDGIIAAHLKPLDARIPNAEGVQRRARLLWWKEARYSQTASQSYAGATAIATALLAAIDLHEQVPTHTPRSVEAFLQAAVESFASGEDQPLEKWIGKLHQDATREVIFAKLPRIASEPDLLCAALASGAGSSTVFHATETWTPAQLSLALFRELQALRALNVGQV